jgi:predicted permease
MTMDWNQRIRDAFAAARHAPDPDVIEELAQHARAMFEADRAEGFSPAEADRRVTQEMEQWCRQAATLRHRSRRPAAPEPPTVEPAWRGASLLHDMRYVARLLGRQARFALLVIVTMAAGIGATTALFSVTYGVLMKPLPWPDADRLIVVTETRGGKAPRFQSFTNVAYLAWRERASTIEDIGAWSLRTVTMSDGGEPERIRVTQATPSLVRILGIRPLAGSVFTDEDADAPVILLSESLWMRRFAADRAIAGRIVSLDGQPFTVAGVIPDAMLYPDQRSQAITPLRVRPAAGNDLSMFNAVAKLRPGVTSSQAAAEGTSAGRFVADTGMTTVAIFGERGPVEISAASLGETLTSDVRRPLYVLLMAVALLLVIATMNVAGLQIARATSRHREFAIRAALGASSGRLVQQLVIESLLLGVAAGAGGLGLAWALHRVMPTLLPADFPRGTELGLDMPVVVFSAAITIAASILFGVLPALRVRRLNLMDALAEDGTSPAGGGARTRVARARLLAMTAQVAIACMLLVGASLLVRSFYALLHADRGFDPAPVLSARLSMPEPLYAPERRHQIVTGILDRLSAARDVRAAAIASELPLIPGGSTGSFTLPPRTAGGEPQAVQASPRLVSPHYFAALGLRMVAGRPFGDGDRQGTAPVAVVNETFARTYLGGDPLNAALPMGFWGGEEAARQARVIGVVEDVRYIGASTASLPEMYYSYRQFGQRLPIQTVMLLVRPAGNPAAFAGTVRSVVREVDPALAAEAVMTLEERLLTMSLARPRLYALLLAGFAGVALLVTGVGLLAVLSYLVAQRTREFGVRVALGARRMDVMALVVWQGMRVTLGGIAVGLALSVPLARALSSLLYGVAPADTLTFTGVPVVLLLISGVACFVPVYRAARLDPIRALRS